MNDHYSGRKRKDTLSAFGGSALDLDRAFSGSGGGGGGGGGGKRGRRVEDEAEDEDQEEEGGDERSMVSDMDRSEVSSGSEDGAPFVHYSDADREGSGGGGGGSGGGSGAGALSGMGGWSSGSVHAPSRSAGLSAAEVKRRKLQLLKRFRVLREKKGVVLSQEYTYQSSLDDMQTEYDSIVDDFSRENSIQMQGNVLMAMMYMVENVNRKYDPVGLVLDGIHDGVRDDITSYDDLFGRVYDHYKKYVSDVSPLAGIGLKICTQIAITHCMNQALMSGSNIPSAAANALNNDPALARQFHSAAIQTMMQQSPHVGTFLADQLPPQRPLAPPRNGGGPLAAFPPTEAPPLAYAPPIHAAGERLDTYIAPGPGPPAPITIARSFPSSSSSSSSEPPPAKTMRRDMRGPSDLADILQNTRTKTIAIALENPLDAISAAADNSFSVPSSFADPPPPSAPRGRKRKQPVSVQL